MPNQPIPPFHLAFPSHDLSLARSFYGGLLGCSEGRSSEDWIDFNFHGHQIVAHLVHETPGSAPSNAVDGHGVPVRHFGVVLSMEEWGKMAETLTAAGVEFLIKPYIRFKRQPGEQATMFFLDPSHNAIEFKAFANIASLFAR